MCCYRNDMTCDDGDMGGQKYTNAMCRYVFLFLFLFCWYPYIEEITPIFPFYPRKR